MKLEPCREADVAGAERRRCTRNPQEGPFLAGDDMPAAGSSRQRCRWGSLGVRETRRSYHSAAGENDNEKGDDQDGVRAQSCDALTSHRARSLVLGARGPHGFASGR